MGSSVDLALQEPGLAKRHRLEPASLVARRLEAQGLELARHVERRQVVAARARVPSLEEVVGEEGHVGTKSVAAHGGQHAFEIVGLG